MVKVVIPIEDDVIEGLAALLKMNAPQTEKEKINTAISKLREVESVEVNPDDFEDQKNEICLAMASLAIAKIA